MGSGLRLVFLAGVLLGLELRAAAPAQDVPGIELCTHEASMERRTSCLQSNVGYLQTLIAKNSAAAQQRLTAAAGEIGALRSEVAALKGAVAALQARIERLEAAAKRAPAAPAAEKPAAKH
jgi:ubiquinone biosynthesis protein UbiJ